MQAPQTVWEEEKEKTQWRKRAFNLISLTSRKIVLRPTVALVLFSPASSCFFQMYIGLLGVLHLLCILRLFGQTFINPPLAVASLQKPQDTAQASEEGKR